MPWLCKMLSYGNSAVLPLMLHGLLFSQLCTLEVWVVQGKLIYNQAKMQILCLDHPAGLTVFKTPELYRITIAVTQAHWF